MIEFELQILRECAGELPPSHWGAAVGVALEFLKGSGYIGENCKPTPKGIKALEDAREKRNARERKT